MSGEIFLATLSHKCPELFHALNGNRWNVAPQLLTLVKRPLTLEDEVEKTISKSIH
ncbi:hypothetical protein [Xenorhabdus vietnamensis]|uniref:hypothetical protein n=1 Tax=Xenorhabdus vietnamensis TaxID=351656 RepID=UPI00142E0287|nr:hypothetical protein [Xenorhabdus vietnamensis]